MSPRNCKESQAPRDGKNLRAPRDGSNLQAPRACMTQASCKLVDVEIKILVHQHRLVTTGIKVSLEPGKALRACDRSCSGRLRSARPSPASPSPSSAARARAIARSRHRPLAPSPAGADTPMVCAPRGAPVLRARRQLWAARHSPPPPIPSLSESSPPLSFPPPPSPA